MKIRSNSQKQTGFALIEALIAIIVISVGLLGVSVMLIQSIRFNHDSNIRTQALFLATDMAERIRNNQTLTDPGMAHILNGNVLAYAGITGGEANPTCIGSDIGCDAGQLRQYDGHRWGQMIVDTLPGGSGSVTQGSSPNTLAITVSWLEQDDSAGSSAEGVVQKNLVIEVLPNLVNPDTLPPLP